MTKSQSLASYMHEKKFIKQCKKILIKHNVGIGYYSVEVLNFSLGSAETKFLIPNTEPSELG